MTFLGDLKKQLQAKPILYFNSWNPKDTTQVQSWLEHVVIEFFQILDILTTKEPVMYFALFPKTMLTPLYLVHTKSWLTRKCDYFILHICLLKLVCLNTAHLSPQLQMREMYVHVCVWWWWWWWWQQRPEFSNKTCNFPWAKAPCWVCSSNPRSVPGPLHYG